ncbi:TPA: hypothetical protein U2C91_001608 [Streptococcus suis]|nr:hypothetical protein [Streptococcus suis]HEM6290293.1 hypothetical protein [Streptococcus suis]HEP1820057.1 hypothetical protein [Streptococcus suis]
MTKFEVMDNMDTNFVVLSDQELMDMEAGSITGVILFTYGVYQGYTGMSKLIQEGNKLWNLKW